MANITDILLEIVSFYSSEYGRGIPKTKLLKLAYLVEVEYTRRSGERLTDSDWVYYLYGPYLFDYDKILHDSGVAIEEVDCDEEKQANIISPPPNYKSSIDFGMRLLIQKIVRQYGPLDLRKLLDYVYFETEPMMNATERFEHLDFSTVLPQDYYKVEKLTIPKKKEQAILTALKKKLEMRRARDCKRDSTGL